MKKNLVIFILVCFSIYCYCQQITFQKMYPTPSGFVILEYEIIQSQDKGYLTGNSQVLMKLDSMGQMEWMKQIPDGSFYVRNVISLTSCINGGYLTVGNPIIMKLDNNYNINWIKELPVLSYGLFSVRQTQDIGFIIGGEIDFQTIPDSRYFLLKTDSSGIVSWFKVYDMISTQNSGFLTLAPDGGFVLSGENLANPYSKVVILKVDSMGNSQWAKNYGTSNSAYIGAHIAITSDNGYIITGYRNLHYFLLKIDSFGNIVWEKFYQAGIYSTSRWVEETNDKGFIVAADIEDSLGRQSLLMKTDSIGDLQWARRLGSGTIWSTCVKQTEDGGYVLSARKTVGVNERMYIIKTDSLGHTNGCHESNPVITVSNLLDTVINVPVSDSIISITSIPVTLNTTFVGSEIPVCSPIGMEDVSNENVKIEIYPNPFTSRFKVSGLRLEVGAKNEVIVYDLMGEKVFEKKLFPNQANDELNLSFLQQGVYFINVKVNGRSYTKKVLKM